MTTLRRPLAAFTLIEMVISLGLAMAILYTAFSAFRVAAQSVTIANRLSTENQLLRAGFMYADEAVDFWNDVDDPASPTQPLRADSRTSPAYPGDGTGAAQTSSYFCIQGLPFTPFVNPTTPANSLWPMVSGGADPEACQGFDGTDLAWSAADQRTWCRVNLADTWQNSQIMGRYAMIANVDSDNLHPLSLGSPAWSTQAVSAGPPTNSMFTDPLESYATRNTINSPIGDETFSFLDSYCSATETATTPTIIAPHPWLMRQTRGLYLSLGYYGMFEYLPANAIVGWYQHFDDGEGCNPDGTINPGNYTNIWSVERPSQRMTTAPNGIPITLLRDSGYDNLIRSAEWLPSYDWNHRSVRSRFSLSFLTAIGLVDPTTSTNLFAANDSEYAVGMWSGGNFAQSADAAAFIANDTPVADLLATRPVYWPTLKVSIQRYVRASQFSNVCRIDLVSPLTGEAKELSFNIVGTTLRGARQQRTRDPGQNNGWAYWWNSPASPALKCGDASHPYPNLDMYENYTP